MKHKIEINRWADIPDGTYVWYFDRDAKIWQKTLNPHWFDDVTYIVNDKWAELRKAYYDGFTIQWRYTEDEKWKDIEDISSLEYMLYEEGDSWKVYRTKSDFVPTETPVYE